MEGQGFLTKQVIKSVTQLSNLVFIHYSGKDFRSLVGFDELVSTVKEIKRSDRNILVCILLRDYGETVHLTPEEFPPKFKESLPGLLDAVIKVKDLKTDYS